ncbi:MAG: cardiolipin synthase [Myxococcota bacterium]|jgi:cardiolipin synthase
MAASIDWLMEFWPVLSGFLLVVLELSAASHALLYKRDSRAAIAWVGIILLVPLIGAFLYVTLGINRIRRKAQGLRAASPPLAVVLEDVETRAAIDSHLRPLDRLGERITGIPSVAGNSVELLRDGDAAFDAMIAAIDGAQKTVGLTTYIFDVDAVGVRFVAALSAAHDRGVEVRVLIDAVGARYSRPLPWKVLQKQGVTVARFLPTRVPWRLVYANLRSHRKLLLVDSNVAFTGGMNIREGTAPSVAPRHPFRDLHSRICGPVVGQLLGVFIDDWRFAAREQLSGWAVSPLQLEPCGQVAARVVPDGPDEDFEKLRLVLLGAVGAAESSVQIITPYFLPDEGLITALTMAAMRGVVVDIIVPDKNNLRLVQWASWPIITRLVQRGCRVWASQGTFDHTKLMVVDGSWTLVGSGNWDPRSLRLNFELNVECYGTDLGERAGAIIGERLSSSERITAQALASRSLLRRLRDGLARLLTPYL